MYSISPEDRAELVMRQQEAWRREKDLERIAAAASTPSTRRRPEAQAVVSQDEHHLRQSALHVLHALTGGHGMTPNGLVR